MRLCIAITLAASVLWAQPAKRAAAKVIIEKPARPAADKPSVARTSMQPVEKSIDARLERANPDDPYVLLGNARGVYLEGYGAVLTAEVNLVNSPGISPFHQTITPEEKARTLGKKQQRLPKLRELMKAMLLAAAADLRSVPLNEQIVIGVSLFHYYWEDTSGLPSQILMQATRQQLLSRETPDSIRVQEF